MRTSRAQSFVVVVAKENNKPGARNAYTFRAPSLIVIVVVVGCYGGDGGGGVGGCRSSPAAITVFRS
jgi:hypothetical protein